MPASTPSSHPRRSLCARLQGGFMLALSIPEDDRFFDDKADILDVTGFSETWQFALRPGQAPEEGLLAFLRLVNLGGGCVGRPASHSREQSGHSCDAVPWQLLSKTYCTTRKRTSVTCSRCADPEHRASDRAARKCEAPGRNACETAATRVGYIEMVGHQAQEAIP